MRIRNDIAKTVVLNYITETFSRFEFNPANVLNSFVAKMYVHNNFDKFTQIVSKDGYIDLMALEENILSDIERLGRFDIPALGTTYLFTADDIKRLITKMKENGEND